MNTELSSPPQAIFPPHYHPPTIGLCLFFPGETHVAEQHTSGSSAGHEVRSAQNLQPWQQLYIMAAHGLLDSLQMSPGI